eukprot:scaffold3306_cov151-Skeletonema_menzelii.AAC.7
MPSFHLGRSIIFVIALVALVQHGVAFSPVPSSVKACRRGVSCNAINRKNTTPTAKKPVATGIGGLNNAFKISKPTTAAKKSAPPTKKSNTPAKKKQPTGSVFNVKMSEETPWSSILLSFLIPWRNPNSIFLYLLIIVFVLGKMNEP